MLPTTRSSTDTEAAEARAKEAPRISIDRNGFAFRVNIGAEPGPILAVPAVEVVGLIGLRILRERNSNAGRRGALPASA